MEHGCGMQINRSFRDHALRQDLERIRRNIAVTEHHTFRAACGAARIEDGGEIVGRRHGIRHRPAHSYQRFVLEHPIR